MPIPAELQSLLTELKISPPTKEHDEVLTVEALIAQPAVADMGCSFSKNLLIKDKKVGQQGQSAFFGRAPARPLRLLGERLAALGSLALPGKRPAHWAPRHRLGCSS